MYLKFIYLLLFALLLSACQTEDKKRQAHLEELLSCKPETPLSKGELYELAMQDYWHQHMEKVWSADKEMVEWQEENNYGDIFSGPIDKKVATKRCGLTWTWLGKPDKITKNACYPRKITQYHTFNDLNWSAHVDEYEDFDVFMESRDAIYYHPDSDPPIYLAENYNKPVNFSMVEAQPRSFSIYPKDCCSLTTYQEIKLLEKSLEGRKEILLFRNEGGSIPNKEITNYSFLIIKTYMSTLSQNTPYHIIYRYYPISHCGQLLTN